MVEEQVDLLSRSGFDVLPVIVKTSDRLEDRSYAVRSAMRVATGIGSSPQETLASFNPDVVHLHNTFPNLATNWLKWWGGRTVTTLHNYRTLCSAATLFRDGKECYDCLARPIIPAVTHGCYGNSRLATVPVAIASSPQGSLRRILKMSRRLVVLNDLSAKIFSENAGRRPTVIPNFVDPVPRRNPTLEYAFVGRLSDEKGVSELLASWPAGKRLDVYGDGPLRGEVEIKVAKMPNVSLLGHRSRSELRGLVAQYKAIVVPSVCAEGLPSIIIESLSSGVPVIVSSSVSVGPELVQAGVGVALPGPSFGPPDLLRAVDVVERSGDEMRAASARLAADLYSPEAWLSSITEVYESLRGAPVAL